MSGRVRSGFLNRMAEVQFLTCNIQMSTYMKWVIWELIFSPQLYQYVQGWLMLQKTFTLCIHWQEKIEKNQIHIFVQTQVFIFNFTSQLMFQLISHVSNHMCKDRAHKITFQYVSINLPPLIILPTTRGQPPMDHFCWKCTDAFLISYSREFIIKVN